jgi:phosphoglycolate phosphatase-like HAD superfamily hydrolase
MRFTDVAWDFDGTLYNSYPHIIYCMDRALKSLGHTADLGEIEGLVHQTIPHAYRYYAPICGCAPEDVSAAYREQVAALGVSDRITLYEGIEALLRDLTAAGIRNHICSNRKSAGCLGYLRRDGLLQCFDVISCPDVKEGLKGKPEPDLVQLILDEKSIAPEAMVMVGDRNLDHEAAHAAGVGGIFFDPDGFATVTCSPEFTAPDVEALRKILLG